jgi:hypothetical protein
MAAESLKPGKERQTGDMGVRVTVALEEVFAVGRKGWQEPHSGHGKEAWVERVDLKKVEPDK